jgi:hypothetical protein
VSETAVDNPEETMRITVVWQLVSWLRVVVAVHDRNHVRLHLMRPFEAHKFNKIIHLGNFCKMWGHMFVSLMFIPCIIRHIRRYQQYALTVPLVYSMYWLQHVSAVACHHQGAC